MRLKRRQHFVDSSVQGSLLRRILIHWVLFFTIACLAVVVMQALMGDPNLPMIERIQDEAGEFVFLGIILLSLFPAFMLDTIRFSNRFVGPIARLRRVLRELGDEKEDVEVLKFRDSEFWAEVAGDFNKVSDIVRNQRDEITRLRHELEDAKESQAAS